MDSNDLRIFHAVALEGNITKAAIDLGYVQSNVTARIRHMETEFGTPLFYRQRGMVLTPAGERLLPYAEKILHLFQEVKELMCDPTEPSGRLAIGANYAVSSINLPEAFSQYHTEYPKVDLSLVTAGSEELITKLLHFQLDGAFVKSSSFEEKNFIKELVYEEKFALITSPQITKVEDIYVQPFLMNTVGCPNRELLISFLKANGIYDVRFIEFNNLDSIINGVISGLGASFVPESSIKQYEQAKLLRSFSVPEQYNIVRTFFIRYRDSVVTSAFAKFIEILKVQHRSSSTSKGEAL